MKRKHLLKVGRRSRNREPLIDRVLNKIMAITFIIFIVVVVITISWVLYELIDWTPVE